METNVKTKDGSVMESIFPPANGVIEKAKEKGESMWNSTRSNSRKTWNSTKIFIQKHPAQAVGYAVLFGAVVAALLYPKGQD